MLNRSHRRWSACCPPSPLAAFNVGDRQICNHTHWSVRFLGRALPNGPFLVAGIKHVRNEFTAIIEQDGDWFIAYSPEIPGANGLGRTLEECRASLAEAISLILADRREDGLRGVPVDAIRETVTIE